MKKYLAFALTLILLLSLCATGYAAPLRASAKDAEAQINVIFRDFGSCRQADSDGTWFYAVTDLDHNGRLELLAASVQASSLLPAAKVWELNADRSALQPCRLNIAENEVFANILTDSAETRYDKAKDAWFYLVNDFYQVSAEDAFVVKSAVVLNSGELEYGALAYEDIGPSGSRFTDTDDNLSPSKTSAISETASSRTARKAAPALNGSRRPRLPSSVPLPTAMPSLPVRRLRPGPLRAPLRSPRVSWL